MHHCDIPTIPLSGITLIEASAGTGKTYTICGLVLRLLLEKELPIEQILVVTYTEAATEELREKIRTRIREILEVFKGDANEDPLLCRLSRNFAGEPEQARQLLTSALRNFDQAVIHTIHGFCQRMLVEFGLESGALFDAELITSEEELIREIVEDFWRQRFYLEGGLFIDFLRNTGLLPETLISFVKPHLHRPYQEILPIPEPEISTRLAADEDLFKSAFTAICRAWPQAREQVAEFLLHHPGLNRNRYRKKLVPGWLAAMDRLVAAGRPNPGLFTRFEKFTTSELDQSMKSGHPPPAHVFFDLCQELHLAGNELADSFTRTLVSLKAELLTKLRPELARRKELRNLISFDDLLIRLQQGLAGSAGRELAGAIARKYPAGLIDEFQDTDPVQYDIFKRIFQDSDQSMLCLIGDPKQAIYSFRGADVFTYIDAAASLAGPESCYTLATNYRSTPGLITAVNAIFARVRTPFVLSDITFHPVAAGRAQNRQKELMIDGQPAPPFTLWFFRRGQETTKPMTKALARQRILQAIGDEIVRMLNLGAQGRAEISGQPLTPADIAILVRTNHEARLAQKSLIDRRVPCVLHSTESLFVSNEAWEMALILKAIGTPDDQSRLQAALATQLMGVAGERILEMVEGHDPAGEEWFDRFAAARELWQHSGLLAMFRSFLAQHRLRARLLGFPDGERRLTNFLHLAEVLDQLAIEKKLGISGLLHALDQRLHQGPEDQEEQLRLESDSHCVRVVTIHKAKGLEYPVLFCPFSWEGTRENKSEAAFHLSDINNRSRLVLDLGSSQLEQHRELADQEELAENLRLFYVALTRAKSCCYLAWGAFKGAETSAAAYLLHQLPGSAEEADPGAIAARVRAATDNELMNDLQALAVAAPGAISLTSPPAGPEEQYCPTPIKARQLEVARLATPVATDRKLTSFSGLIAGHRRTAEPLAQNGRTSPIPMSETRQSQQNIFSFPAGTRAGIFFHSLLEQLDFTRPPLPEEIRESLDQHNFDPAWDRTIIAMLHRLVHLPLPATTPDGSDILTLSAVAPGSRLNELEFTFPLSSLTASRLERAFVDCGRPLPELDRLDFAPTRGFLKGFIDLVFEHQGRYYLVDWKSNLLGDRIESYHRDQLDKVMAEELYTLQYHLYTVALHQYLSARLPDYRFARHFGDVFYLFLRGIDPDHGADYGVFRDRPEEELISRLAAALIPEQGERQ